MVAIKKSQRRKKAEDLESRGGADKEQAELVLRLVQVIDSHIEKAKQKRDSIDIDKRIVQSLLIENSIKHEVTIEDGQSRG